MSQAAPARALSERLVLALLAAIQFVNVLDFMMVMPLGPDFALALGIPTSRLGLIAGSYTAAAAVSGLLGMLFLDRFDRKRALAVALGGLVLGTIAGGYAIGFHTLLAARVLAGLFGGPASSLSLAVIADVIAPERRGRAMGTVMGAFSIASVFGVPAGLELARLGGWRTPFFGVASLGLLVLIATLFLLPPLRLHLEAGPPSRVASPFAMLRRPAAIFMLLTVATNTMSVFAVVPNLATYLQFNAGYPRAHLGLLYLVGGIVSFFTMRVTGRLSDRFGTTVVASIGTAVFVATQLVGFIPPMPLVPVLVVFVGFMLSGSIRMVPMSALSTRVPSPSQRARYMSVQSAVQHIASATAAGISSLMLSELPGGKLKGMANVAWLSIALATVLPFLIWAVESRVRASERLSAIERSASVGRRSLASLSSAEHARASMLIEHYAAMARYNRWMNARIYELAGTLSDEQRKRDLGAFFKSIHGTLNHLLLADRTWLGRLSGDRTLSQSFDASGQPIAVKSLDQELYADFELLRREREKTDADVEHTVSSLTPEDLERSMSYRTSTGVAREHPLWWALSQMFNHQTHHRGQVTALFTRLGQDPGVTDLIYFLWSALPAQPQTPPA